MARIPSKNILAKDIIGQAEEIASVEDARKLVKRLGIVYYNNAISEIYNILLMADINEFDNDAIMSVEEENLESSSARVYIGDLSDNNFDNINDIKNIMCLTSSKNIQCIPVDRNSINSYKELKEADFPYNGSIIYNLKGLSLDIIFGKDVVVSTPIFTITYRKNLTILTSENYNSLYIELPQNYSHLLVNRIASYAELRNGINNNSLSTVKMVYEQILSNIEPSLKRKIIDSMQMENV